jgi:serine/threonine protein phosphatase PrpC
MGPARVWLKHENIPGLAMSRSFGDFVASQVGVIAEPEVTQTELRKDHRFLMVASDGVWEFLSNE